MTPAPAATRAFIDFAQPSPGSDGEAQRLRASLGSPLRELVAWQAAQVPDVLEAVAQAAQAGHWCVGWLAYEAATAFDPAFVTHAPLPDMPLVWFGVFEAPPAPDHAGASAEHRTRAEPAPRIDWRHEPQRAAFEADVATVKASIAEGRYYQVNLTAPCIGTLQGSPQALFAALQHAQPGGYAACIEAGEHAVLSVSPELFFDWQADAQGCGPLLTRPMKGTAPRGSSPEHDAQQAQRLRASPKERAENVMIVDLLRNDLSRIAEPFSVQVPRLFHLQALPAVWQMTSDVVAQTRAGTRLRDVFGALFPCGSITGAPKVEAMRAIRELESGPRGVYCGAVGVVRPSPNGGLHATFNVPIRTVQLHTPLRTPATAPQGTQLRASFGSGLVADADPAAEWAEWRHKRAFIDRVSQPFELLETLALVDGQLRHLPRHLARLQRAAKHFGFAWPAPALDAALHAVTEQHGQGAWRVRLRLTPHGQVHTQAFALQATPTPVRLQLANRPLEHSDSEFVRFKTTRRAHYEVFSPAPDSGVFDTVLFNRRGELTETTFGNIALQLADGRWVTPPESCGLLAGIGREVALAQGRLTTEVITLDALSEVRAWAFLNSLRGWLPAELAPESPPPRN